MPKFPLPTLRRRCSAGPTIPASTLGLPDTGPGSLAPDGAAGWRLCWPDYPGKHARLAGHRTGFAGSRWGRRLAALLGDVAVVQGNVPRLGLDFNAATSGGC